MSPSRVPQIRALLAKGRRGAKGKKNRENDWALTQSCHIPKENKTAEQNRCPMSRSPGPRRVSRRLGNVVTRPLDQTSDEKGLSGFSAGTLILTLDGELPVEHLAPGDRIVTRAGARILTGISSRSVQGAYVIRPHTLGSGRPAAPVIVGSRQEVLLRDWRARALYDRDQAQVPVARLADGEHISATAATVRLFRLEFAQDEVIYAGGLEAAVAGATH
jgi:hypothetical protein